MLKTLRIIAGLLFVLCLPVLLVTSNVRYAVNTPRLYEYSFNKYEVEEVTGVERAELDRAARGMIRYFNSGDKLINIKVAADDEQIDLFSPKEVAHLKDVKHLIQVDYWVQIGTLAYALAFVIGTLALSKGRRWRWLLGWLTAGSVFTLFAMLVLGLVALFGFDEFFLQFHYFSFSNELWKLNEWDILPQMFPEGFFYDATKFITMATAAEVAVLGGISGVVLFRTRKKKTLATSGK